MILRTFSAALVAAAVAAPASAQSTEERAAARDLLAKRSSAVVTVRATVKLRGFPGPGQGEDMEDTVTGDAVVLDGTGLTVTALSQLDPSDVLKRVLGSMPGAPAMDLAVDQSNIRLRLDNGQEVPARIVLRDKDLDLVFLRPTTAPSTPMASVDMNSTAKAQAADLVLVLQRFGEVAGWKTGVAFGSVIAVVDKPRTMYLISDAAPGSPVFDATGRFLGIVVMRTQEGGRMSMFSAMNGDAGGMMPVVLPVAEILELAKQAK